MNAKGFTLLELMIVIAIIAILSAIALPSYSSYLVRSRLSQVIQMTSPIQSKVSSAIASPDSSNTLLGDAQSSASNISNPYISSVSVSSTGVITVTTSTNSNLPNAAQSKTIIFTPNPLYGANTTANPPTWQCSPGTIPAQFVQGICN